MVRKRLGNEDLSNKLDHLLEILDSSNSRNIEIPKNMTPLDNFVTSPTDGQSSSLQFPSQPAEGQLGSEIPNPTGDFYQELDMVDWLEETDPDIWRANNPIQDIFGYQGPDTVEPPPNSSLSTPTTILAPVVDIMTRAAPGDVQLDNHTEPRRSEHCHYSNPSFSKSELHSVTLPADLVDSLVDIYFHKVQAFLPIFHRPRFYEMYVHNGQSGSDRYQHLCLKSALILNGILSLSARFSQSKYFDGIPPKERGAPFARHAREIYDLAVYRNELETPTLAYLQGCILLAFYQCSYGHSSRGWHLSGFCSRLAYDLGLSKIDEDIARGKRLSSQWLSGSEWTHREEARRAWWSVWELDAFASVLSCRPFSIDRNQIYVLLPVSDAAWFADDPVASSPIGPGLDAWKSLRDCPNQDERAWFLLCTHLMILCHNMGQQPSISEETFQELETAVSCFALLLPARFHISSGSIVFDSENFSKSNCIMSTILMLQTCRILLGLLSERIYPTTPPTPSNQAIDIGRQDSAALQNYKQYSGQIIRAIQSWIPEYVALAGPFIACTVVGPAAINVRVSREGSTTRIHEDLLKQTIAQFAAFWEIGSLLLAFVHSSEVSGRRDIMMSTTESDFAVSFPRLEPASSPEGIIISENQKDFRSRHGY